MKLFAVFMCFTMLFTGIDFCESEDACDSTGSIVHSSSSPEKKDKTEVCSPFCNCSGCVFSALLPRKTCNNLLSLVTHTEFIAFANSYLTTTSSSIWQPPKNA